MVMESSGGDTMALGVKCASETMVSKSLDNIVGNLWQARQESSGSSVGNQSPRNGEDLSDGEPGSPGMGRQQDHHHQTSLSHQQSMHEDTDSHQEFRETNGSNANAPGGVRVKDPRDLLFPNTGRSPSKSDFADTPRFDDKDPTRLLSQLANFPGLSSLEAFQRGFGLCSSTTPPSLTPTAAIAAVGSPFPRRPPSQPATPSSRTSGGSPVSFGGPDHRTNSGGGNNNSGSGQNNWSFEEQFKQLYEIDDNPKRKEFLDELFSFMQKRGTPINRLPIMAKQVLDLYELYNLVTARGGLVEVINKKLWQEVIKGLGLPSSITSAAFTLRTQYTKYLYPLECQKKNLSNPNELQAAIEGNKREGRRTSYGSYPTDLLPPPQHMGHQNPLHLSSTIGHAPPIMSFVGAGQAAAAAAAAGRGLLNGNNANLTPVSRSPPAPPGVPGSQGDPFAALEMTRLALWKMYNQASSDSAGRNNMPPISLPNLPSLPTDLFNSPAGGKFPDKLPSGIPPGLLTPEKLAMIAASSAHSTSGGKDRRDSSAKDSNDNETTRDEKADHGERAEEEEEENNDNHLIEVADNDAHNSESQSRVPSSENHLDLRDDSNSNGGGVALPEETSTRKRRHSLSAIGDDESATPHDESDVIHQRDEKSSSEQPMMKRRNITMPAGANIKITSRGDGKSPDGSLVVSMEINGINYQGVLFAQTTKSRTS